MYLSINSSHKLSEVVLAFEVAYRSFVSESIIKTFSNENEFKSSLESLLADTKQTSIIFSHRFNSKINSIKKDYQKNYKILHDCNKAYLTKTVFEIEAPFVSVLNDYVSIYYNNIFVKTDLLKGISPNDYMFISEKYNSIRNDLFHPASSNISLVEAKELTQFIRKIVLNINDGYFWFVNKLDIEKSIQGFVNSIEGNPIKVCNLHEIVFSHNKIVCREKELSKLRDCVFGKEDVPFYRTAGSIVVYGYGGLGKTALVLGFLNQIVKESIDRDNFYNIDFLLFFTGKEEELRYSKTSGEVIIQELKKQINSFESFRKNLFEYLSINDIAELANYRRGIVVIDNIETLSEDDKGEIFNFIKTSPNSIQYIITSRHEENGEERLHLEGFSDKKRGKEFLSQYQSLYNLSTTLKENEQEILLDVSKGNTLILVLSLQQLNDGITTIEKIFENLGNTKSANIEKIVDFMYKNTFDKVILELENRGFNVKDVLTVISLYEEPIDLFSLSELAGNKYSISDVEKICDYLSNRLVLNKKGEFYELNDFASKFVFVKLLPDKLTARQLNQKITLYKYNTRLKLRKFEEKRSNKELNEIMNDWKPRTEIERIAIVNVFSLYSPYTLGQNKDIDKLKKEFDKNEAMTTHPYIKFQKAKIFEKLMVNHVVDKVDALDIISSSYEDVIYSIEFEYKYIKNTKSFANVLWFYGQFLAKHYDDHQQALAKFEQAKMLFEALGLNSIAAYKSVINSMIYSYKIVAHNVHSKKSSYYQEAEKLQMLLNKLRAS